MTDAINITIASPFDWKETIPWFLVVIGWIIVDVQQRIRDRKARAENIVGLVKEDLRKLEKLSIAYHLCDSPTPDQSIEIKSLLRCVFFEINNKSLLLSHDQGRLVALRRAVTLKNFDTSDPQPQSTSSDLIQDIGASVENLEEALERNLKCVS